MTPGVCAYLAMMCLISEFTVDRALSGHLLQVTGTDEPAPQVPMQEHNWVQDEEL